MTQKQWKWIVRILLLGTVLAALKVIFFDYTMDEEYQIMMAYRNLEGDSLFREMWEPHQTSAFLCTWLMSVYKQVLGTYTGVLIYLRICTTFIQVGISYYLYRVLSLLFKKEYAFLCGLIYFNIVPKIIQIPEFSNMQLWFFSLTVLPLIQYYWIKEENRRNKWYLLVLAGGSMALEVLSYPSCLILFPFFLVCIFTQSGKWKWRDILLFAGTCAGCAVLWMAAVLKHVSLEEFLRNLKYMLEFDLTHELSGATTGKGAAIISNIAGGIGFMLLAALICLPVYIFCRKKSAEWNTHKGKVVFAVLIITSAEIIQLVLWGILKKGYEVYHLHLLILLLASWFVWYLAGEEKKYLHAGIIGTFISVFAVIYLSDLEMYHALPHGLLGYIFSALVLVSALQKVMKEDADRWIYFLLMGLCVVSIFAKGYTLRGGRNYNVVADTEGIMKYGPAAGILTDYMNAYIYNCNYEDFTAYVTEEDTVLIVANQVFSESTTPYMISGAEVAHYSIVDPTAYDERLLVYWELYPEKEPDVIVVDCWYGQLQEDVDSWIMQYIENEFGYTQVSDGRYVRFYRK